MLRIRLLALVLILAGAFTSCSAARSPARQDVVELARRLVAPDPNVARLLEASTVGFRFHEDEVNAERVLVSTGYGATTQHRFTDLGVRLPASADGVVRVGVSRFSDFELKLTLSGADPASVPSLHEGRVVYRSALPSVHRIVAASDTSLEDLLLLQDEHAPTTFSYHVELPGGIAGAVARDDGSLAFVGTTGRDVLVMAEPVAYDAHGVRRAGELAWDSSTRTLRVRLDARGLAFPVALDPTTNLARWTRVPLVGELPRQGQAMAYDARRREVVLFGGKNLTAFLNDTWRWNGSTWAKAAPLNAPSARWHHAMV